MHTVVVLALHEVMPFDLAVPLEVFGRARTAVGGPAYQVKVAAPSDEVTAGPIRLRGMQPLDSLARAHTVIVPGMAQESPAPPTPVLAALRNAAHAGVRVAAMAAGVLVVADAGLLDGRRATTHWGIAAQLARRHPAVRLIRPGVLYVDDGRTLTSAGGAAGLDMCLHMVRRDYGAAVSAETARLAVMAPERDGAQTQRLAHRPPVDAAGRHTSLQPMLTWLEDNCGADLHLSDIAARVAMTPRTLSRHFREQLGVSPMRWLQRARLRRAQWLLETSSLTVDSIRREAGFASSSAFRQGFRNYTGLSPQAYRQAHRRARTPRPRQQSTSLRHTDAP